MWVMCRYHNKTKQNKTNKCLQICVHSSLSFKDSASRLSTSFHIYPQSVEASLHPDTPTQRKCYFCLVFSMSSGERSAIKQKPFLPWSAVFQSVSTKAANHGIGGSGRAGSCNWTGAYRPITDGQGRTACQSKCWPAALVFKRSARGWMKRRKGGRTWTAVAKWKTPQYAVWNEGINVAEWRATGSDEK